MSYRTKRIKVEVESCSVDMENTGDPLFLEFSNTTTTEKGSSQLTTPEFGLSFVLGESQAPNQGNDVVAVDITAQVCDMVLKEANVGGANQADFECDHTEASPPKKVLKLTKPEPSNNNDSPPVSGKEAHHYCSDNVVESSDNKVTCTPAPVIGKTTSPTSEMQQSSSAASVVDESDNTVSSSSMNGTVPTTSEHVSTAADNDNDTKSCDRESTCSDRLVIDETPASNFEAMEGNCEIDSESPNVPGIDNPPRSGACSVPDSSSTSSLSTDNIEGSLKNKITVDDPTVPSNTCKMSSAPIVGIDLGTTCTSGQFHDGTTPFCPIQFNNGGKETDILESVVSFSPDWGITLYGAEALKQLNTDNAINTVTESKRLMGRNVDNVVKLLKEKVQYEIVKVGSKAMILVEDCGSKKPKYPEQIAGMILTQVKQAFESQTGLTLHSVVLTVPAYFNNSQRRATVRAASLANLNVVQVLNEPTAAAISFGHDLKEPGVFTVLVFDLGGGTFDLSVVRIVKGSGGNDTYTVLKIAGKNYLGGQDLTFQLYERLQIVAKDRGMKLEPLALHSLRSAAEEAKIKLSTATKTALEVENLVDGQNFQYVVTREEFNKLNASNFAAAMEELDKIFGIEQAVPDDDEQSNDKGESSSKQNLCPVKKRIELEPEPLNKEDITHVLFTGGSSQVPEIATLLKAYFAGGTTAPELVSLTTRFDVVRGAAIIASQLNNVPGYGGITLKDCVPYNIGLKRADGKMILLAKRNSSFPVLGMARFYLPKKKQTKYLIEVYEGNHVEAKKNQFLGSFAVKKVRLTRNGYGYLEVTIKIAKTTGEMELYAFDSDPTNNVHVGKLTITHKQEEQEKEDFKRMGEDMEQEKLRVAKDSLLKSLKHNVFMLDIKDTSDFKFFAMTEKYRSAVEGIISCLYGPGSRKLTLSDLQNYETVMKNLFIAIVNGRYEVSFEGIPCADDFESSTMDEQVTYSVIDDKLDLEDVIIDLEQEQEVERVIVDADIEIIDVQEVPSVDIKVIDVDIEDVHPPAMEIPTAEAEAVDYWNMKNV